MTKHTQADLMDSTIDVLTRLKWAAELWPMNAALVKLSCDAVAEIERLKGEVDNADSNC